MDVGGRRFNGNCTRLISRGLDVGEQLNAALRCVVPRPQALAYLKLVAVKLPVVSVTRSPRIDLSTVSKGLVDSRLFVMNDANTSRQLCSLSLFGLPSSGTYYCVAVNEKDRSRLCGHIYPSRYAPVTMFSRASVSGGIIRGGWLLPFHLTTGWPSEGRLLLTCS